MNGSPQVAYTSDNKNFETIDTDNSVLLDTVLSKAISSAFAPPTPNLSDPLFIQLRVKSSNKEIYKEIAKSVDNTLKSKLYTGNVTGDTKFSDLMGKIVIIMDKTIDARYNEMSHCSPEETNCYELAKYVNMESGSNYLYLQHYTSVLQQSPNRPIIMDSSSSMFSTTITTMSIVQPDVVNTTSKNPESIETFILNQGSQIIPYRFYSNDKGLFNYEAVFNYWKGGIVPLALVIKGFEEHKTK
jgi:hypothetical protein